MRPQDEIEMQRVEWLWRPYLQRGALNLLTGDPGIGKTSLVCELAAALSTGRALPGDTPQPPMNVWVMNGEDGLEDTISWRLFNQGSDPSRVWLTGQVVALEGGVVREIEERVREKRISFLVIDPIQAWMGSEVDMNRANETRAWAGPIRDMAVRTGCCVLFVRHRRKGAPGDSHLYSGLGSIDISGFARSEISVTKSPDGLICLHRTKGNVGKQELKLSYTLESHPDPQNDHAILTWRGFTNPETTPGRGSSIPKTLAKAVRWLRERLANGPVAAVLLYQEAAKLNFSERTLSRARQEVAETRKTPDGWFWYLKPALADGEEGDGAFAEQPEHTIRGDRRPPAG